MKKIVITQFYRKIGTIFKGCNEAQFYFVEIWLLGGRGIKYVCRKEASFLVLVSYFPWKS